MLTQTETELLCAVEQAIDFMAWYRSMVAGGLVSVTPYANQSKPSDYLALHDLRDAIRPYQEAREREKALLPGQKVVDYQRVAAGAIMGASAGGEI